tara:strand:- start:75 stop:542 length:468 start_codon:yes stop_codon:yes gene_type:complete
MAITQALCTSFKAQALLGVHDFRPDASATSDVFKLALYSAGASLSAGTTAYVTDSESVGTNYVAGGSALVNLGVTTGDTSGFVDFTDLTFLNVTVAAAGCLIYNNTPSTNDNAGATLTNAAICVLDFGGTKTSTAGDFSVIFPANTSAAAIIRIA